MRPAGESAIAGVIDDLPDLLGVYAGSVLSALRLKPGNWAGAAACWGLENREAAVRFVAATPGNPHGANVELKLIDPSANPYLAAAAFLGSALRGIDRGLEPSRRSRRRTRRKAAHPPPLLPTDQRAVIEALETLADRRRTADTRGDRRACRGRDATRSPPTATCPPAETTQALRLAWSC